jgi:hypothetical protein
MVDKSEAQALSETLCSAVPQTYFDSFIGTIYNFNDAHVQGHGPRLPLIKMSVLYSNYFF